MKYYPSTMLLATAFLVDPVSGFCNHQQQVRSKPTTTTMALQQDDFDAISTTTTSSSSRRQWFQHCSTAAALLLTQPASAADGQKMFAPGGTLVDYQVGVAVGNERASKSRRNDNSNVVFGQDYYYKFGTAPAFIPKGDTSFPVKMPFVLSQQRYDNLKKYRERVQRGIDQIASLKEFVDNGNYAQILEAEAPEYSIRPLGLLANGFLASENTGTTNELFLARWYINEIYLDVGDVRKASSKEEAQLAFENAILALNSYLGMLNRSITSKVGDPFELL